MNILSFDDEYRYSFKLENFIIPVGGGYNLYVSIDYQDEDSWEGRGFHIYYLTDKMWLNSFYWDGADNQHVELARLRGNTKYIDFQINSEVFFPSSDNLFNILWELCKFRDSHPVIKKIFEDLIDEEYIQISEFNTMDVEGGSCDESDNHSCLSSICYDCEWIEDSYSFEKLSDFNYKDTVDELILLDCKIKKIFKPKLYEGKYKQKVVFYDDNTNFELNAILDHEVADYDKWKKNDNVRLIGMYTFNHNYVERFGEKDFMCLVPFMKKIDPIVIDEIDDFDNDAQLSRSQEIDGYDEWRDDILAKDDYKCVCCGLDKHLHVHHLFGYAENPELAVNENNGVTLCKFCHGRYHSIYGKKNINPRDFIEYINKYGV